MTPDELRALAERVENGADVPLEDIAVAVGLSNVAYYPNFLVDINATGLLWDGLCHHGWVLQVYIMLAGVDCAAINNERSEYGWVGSSAATEARARTALALRCRAAEMEAENSQ